ncbi:MAG: protein-methionine-sulfoxide reductase heme-binding subunit MsrQ [Porticoccaceae bacterium]|jgi:sulfoxide reductase heme-binding subunit YedZ|nr:protein-methionine-sulfoxide reductase heme-binding subunit MsrQ [Porticoccaceae bacterium]
MAITVSQKRIPYLKVLVHLAALYPLLNLYYGAFTDQLGGDPVEAVIHFTGIGALNLLLISLLISPIAKRFKLIFLMHFRRMIGLYAFTYALCHMLNFLFFEVQFDVRLFIEEVFERPYITVGMSAFMLLMALAITSITKLRRKMKGKWQTLHNFTYLIALLVVIHFYWSVKSEIIEPLIYFAIYAALMVFRYKKLRGWKEKLLSR